MARRGSWPGLTDRLPVSGGKKEKEKADVWAADPLMKWMDCVKIHAVANPCRLARMIHPWDMQLVADVPALGIKIPVTVHGN